MESVYLTVYVQNFKIEVEAYATLKEAQEHALELARNQNYRNNGLIVENPIEQMSPTGSIWTYSMANHNIAVILIPLPNMKELSVDSSDTMPPSGPLMMPEIPDSDDPEDPNLPGGWDNNNKPITMGYVASNPYDVQDYDYLSYNKQVALVVSRISKRPKFSVMAHPRFVKLTQAEALMEIKAGSLIGETVVAQEIEWLVDYLDDKLSSQ